MTTKLELDWVTTSIDELRDIYKEVIANKLEQSMTNTLHKNPESRTGSDTPETDALNRLVSFAEIEGYLAMIQLARKLERERDEAVSSCHIWQTGHSALVEDHDQRTNKIAAEREGWKKIAVELEKERDSWMSLAGVRREDYLQATTLVNQLNEELAVVRKQNNERLTILQEHGLTEYGN